jgi:ribosomal protein S18 acetylase RimI-like enzyme
VEPLDDESGSGARLARLDEVDSLAQVLAGAFEDDPMMRWFIPGDERWRRHASRLFAWYVRRRIRYGTAFSTEDRRSVALWDDPDHVHMTISERLGETAMGARVFGSTAGRAARGAALMKAHHPQFPHWYLHIIGVAPERRGRGIGSILLQPVLTRCDQEGMRAYLEASSPRNVRLYERHGFEVVEEVRFPKGPLYFAMVRPPRT